jgi:hypothetical protein
MKTNEINSALVRFANTDLRIARENGDMSVCQTVDGRIDVNYNRELKSYTLIGRTKRAENVKAGEARLFLISVYDVQTT